MTGGGFDSPGGVPGDVPGSDPAGGAPARLDGRALRGGDAAVYRELRRVYGPVAPVLLEGDVPVWLVLGYREVQYVAANPQLFARDPRRWNAWDRVPRDWPMLPFVSRTASVLFTEGEEHRRRAGALSDVLAGCDPLGVRLDAERTADAAVDRFAGAGRAELIREYAAPVPRRVVARLLALDESETLDLERDLAASLGDDPQEAAVGRARVHVAMELLLERAARQPGGDLASRLLAHPARLTPDEAAQDLVALFTVGVLPTTDWIGNTLRLMLTDDRFAVSLSGGRRSVGQALTEVLWTRPPMQNVLGRWAAHDTQLGGRRIRRGDCLVLGLAAANADPQVCPYAPEAGADAGALAAAGGGNQAHLAFSHGEHRCPAPAAELAEVIATAAVEVLLDRLPDLALAPARLAPPPALPVHFTPLT